MRLVGILLAAVLSVGALAFAWSGPAATLFIEEVREERDAERVHMERDATHLSSTATAPRARREEHPMQRGAREHELPPARGKTAELLLSIQRDGEAACGRLEFLRGPNAGITLSCPAGQSRARQHDVFPGFHIIQICQGSSSCIRELRLRPRRQSEVAIDFVHGDALRGTVRDESGGGLRDALVTLDGHSTRSASDGSFVLQRVARGRALLTVQADGFANARRTSPDGERELTVTMRPGAELTLRRPAGGGPADLCQVYVLPRGVGPRHGTESAYPWHLLGPTSLRPGEERTLRGLPAGGVTIHGFHRLGFGCVTADVSAGHAAELDLETTARPQLDVHVRVHGHPCANAVVELVADDRMLAQARALGPHRRALESHAIDMLPAARQRARTDTRGHCVFGDWSECAPTRWLIVRASHTRVVEVRGGAHEVTVDLP